MGLPHIVVIDDSDAILAFSRAVLSPHYEVSTAKDGREGLSLCVRLRPQLIVLDLSMPEMDGEQVLAELQANPELRLVPVIIISSEQARAEACLAKGATAHLVKPVRADDLVTVVGRALESARTKAARGNLAVLPLGVGPLELAVPLSDVRHVLLQVMSHPLPGAPSYLTGFVELLGEPICVLDLAARFGVEHQKTILDRMLVIVEHEQLKLALCTDRVRDPEEVAADEVHAVPADHEDGIAAAPDSALQAIVQTSRGRLAVIRPHTLLSRGVWRALPKWIEDAR